MRTSNQQWNSLFSQQTEDEFTPRPNDTENLG